MTRYTTVAVVLHWTIAVLLVLNFALGLWMAEAIDVAETQARAIRAFQWHKSLGLTVLLLSGLRLAWRGAHPPPALPAAMPAWERFAARATHGAFYALMIGLPLSGWLYVSAQWADDKPLNVPTLWFGLFEVPHLFKASALTHEVRQSTAEWTMEAHELLAWGLAALLALHVGAALKHHFINRDDVLARMAPRTGLLLAGVVMLLTAGLWLNPPTSAPSEVHITSSPESDWRVTPGDSEVAFSGTHAGVAFRGRFRRWQADIRFDPDALNHARFGGTFETASASDGVPLHDESLPLKEWFDTARFPTASFHSTRVTPMGEGAYAVDGVLTIKGRPLSVPALALNIRGDRMSLHGRFEIDRAEADLGMESDAEAQYVSRTIAVDVHIEAVRAATPAGR